ncbi:MAG: hypothetical protein V4527_14980 [Pseudomonadota bacterium]
MTTSALQALEIYEKAHARHEAATKTMARAEKLFDKLSRKMSEAKAWKLAGVNLADRRDLKACWEERRALEALKVSLSGLATAEAISTLGWVRFIYAGGVRPANDRNSAISRLASCASPPP